MVWRDAAESRNVRGVRNRELANPIVKSCVESDWPPFEPVVKALVEASHHVRWDGEVSVSDRALSQMTPADTHLNEMTGSAVTVAQEPDVRCDLRVRNIRLELRADIDVGHASGETPEVLRREVVPVVWRPGANRCCNPFISNPHYVMSSRHVRGGDDIDRCVQRHSRG